MNRKAESATELATQSETNEAPPVSDEKDMQTTTAPPPPTKQGGLPPKEALLERFKHDLPFIDMNLAPPECQKNEHSEYRFRWVGDRPTETEQQQRMESEALGYLPCNIDTPYRGFWTTVGQPGTGWSFDKTSGHITRSGIALWVTYQEVYQALRARWKEETYHGQIEKMRSQGLLKSDKQDPSVPHEPNEKDQADRKRPADLIVDQASGETRWVNHPNNPVPQPQ